MRSKCSFILKASLSLVLALVMLFGTMATSLAAVVDNADVAAEADVADEGAQADLAGTGYNTLTVNGGRIYFDATTYSSSYSSYYYYLAVFNSDASWAKTQKLTRISNTGIYYADVDTGLSGQSSATNKDFGIFVSSTNHATTEWWQLTGKQKIIYSYESYTFQSYKNYLLTQDTTDTNKLVFGPAAGGSDYDNGINSNTSYKFTQYAGVYYRTGGSTGAYTNDNTANSTSRGTLTLSGRTWSSGTAVSSASGVTAPANTSKADVAKTTTMTLTATAATGYTLTAVRYNSSSTNPTAANGGTAVSSVTSGTGKNITVTGTKAYSAFFDETVVNVTFQKKLGSAAAVDLQTKKSGITTAATYEADDIPGYSFTGWTCTADSDGDNSLSDETSSFYAATATLNSASNATVSVNAKTAVTLVANYAKNTATISVSKSPAGADGTIKETNSSGSNASASYTLSLVDTQVLYAADGANYSFSGWYATGDAVFEVGDDVYDSTNTDSGTTVNSRTITVRSNGADSGSGTVYAVYVLSSLQIDTDAKSKSSSAGAYAVDASAVSTLTPASGLQDFGDTIELQAVSSNGAVYHFRGWSVDSSDAIVSTDNPYEITVAAAASYHAMFDKGGDVTFKNEDGSAIIQVNSADTQWVWYNGYATAPSDPSKVGYHFDGWSTTQGGAVVDVASTAITADTTFYAVFSAITYDVTVTALGMENTTDGYDVSLTAPTYTGAASLTGVAYNTALTFTPSDNSGYEFVGWVSTSDSAAAVSSFAAGQALTSGATISITTNSATDSNYHIYALYKKIYYVTVYSSWVDDGPNSFHKVAAPPQRVVVTTPESTTRATYTYAYSRDTVGEDLTVSSTGTFNEGNKLQMLAGDTVKLYYTALSSSEAIRGVFFNNDIRYTTEDQEHNLYKNGEYKAEGWGDEGDDEWDYTYEKATTLFADADYYSDEEVENGTYEGELVTYAISQEAPYHGSVDQNTHVVTFTAEQNYRNIDLELASKYRIFFSDTKKIEVTSENADNFYDIGETITANLKVNAKTSSTATHTITKDNIAFYKADASGNKIADQPITNTSIIDKAGATTSTSPSNLITFSGTMPNYNIYVELNVVTSCMVGVGSKCMASPNEGFTTLIDAAGGNSKLGTITTSPSVANNTTGTSKNQGTTVTYSFAWGNQSAGNSWSKYYMFLGWYQSAVNATAPDFTKPRLSTELSYTLTVEKNIRIWAVATRCFFIGGGFTQNASTKEITYSGSSWDNRYEMEYDPSWVNPDTGLVEGRYWFEFPNAPTTNSYTYFRCYDMATGSGQLSFWNQMCGTEASGKAWHNDNTDLFYGHEAGWDNNDEYDSFFGKNTNGAGYFKLTTTNIANGYGPSIYVYFYPRNSSGTGISCNSTFQRTNVYISGGYNGILATNTYPTVTAGPNTTIGGPEGGGWTATHETVKHYQIKNKNGSITIAKNTNSAAYKVSAFVVYDINSKTAYAVKGDDITKSTNTYTATIKPTGDCYVCPVFEKATTNMTVYVRTSDLDKEKWGRMVAMFAWGSSNLNGDYPGQLMIPSSDGDSWYANIYEPNNNKADPDLSGITFSNYYSGTWFTDATSIKDAAGTAVPAGYNPSSGDNVQSFDYREPVALYSNSSSRAGVNTMLRFALKDGENNTSTTSFATLTSNITLGNYSWEYLTNYDGTKHMDLTGKEMDSESTATYYIIAQGDAWYNGDGKLYSTTSIGSKGGSATYTYPKDATYNGNYSVQWYVYNASGQFLFTTLSAALADHQDGLTYIASILEGRGDPYQDKSVKICYNTPVDYGSTTRFSGQWYATVDTKTVDANVEIAIYSDGSYTQMDTSTISGLGTAYMELNYTGADASEAKPGTAVSTGYDSYNLPLWMASLDPVTLHTDATNFLGWYTYDEETEEYTEISKSADYTPSFNSPITYYAVYKAKAIYKYAYTGREGGTKYYTVASELDMTPAEIANAKTPNASNRSDDILDCAPDSSDIALYDKNVTFSYTGATKTADFTLTITGVTQTAKNYTATAHYTPTLTQTLTAPYGTVLEVSDANIETMNSYYAGQGTPYFQGWYTADDGGTLISYQTNFGMVIWEDSMDVYPHYAASPRATVTDFTPMIDRNVISKEFTSEGIGTFFNENLVRFQGEPYARATAAHTGILVFYQNGDDALVTPTSDQLQTIASKIGRTNKRGNASALKARVVDINTTWLNNFNRANLIYTGDYETLNGKSYQVYAYWYDGSTYHFSAVQSGTFA